MRKKTRLRILLSLLAVVLFLGATGGIYMFQEQKLFQQKNDYEIYIRQMDETKVKGFVLVKDIEMGHTLTAEDFKSESIDSKSAVSDLILKSEELIGKTVKVSLKAKQPLGTSLLFDSTELQNDLRDFELSSAVVPSFLKELDYVDVRINFPTGLDYVVLSKKRVNSILKAGDAQTTSQYLRFRINADEILRLSSAIVDGFYKKGTYLYVIKYVEPDAQKEAIVNYPVNPEVRQLILSDPNIVNRAQLSLEKSSRDALLASFAGYGMMEVREKPQTPAVSVVAEQGQVNPPAQETTELSQEATTETIGME